MRFVDRVVFDTSTLVSAALRPASIPSRAFREALGRCEVCVSDETLSELESVLLRSKFDTYLERHDRVAFIEMYRVVVSRCEVHENIVACRDPRDDKFLSLAVSCEAGVIVTSDLDLLDMGTFRRIAIVTPAGFLERKSG